MEKIRVVVANEPRAYRETLAEALRNLCLRAEVIIIEPAALHQHVRRFPPHLVLGSELDPEMLTAGGTVSSVNEADAGALTLPNASVACTVKVWLPSARPV